MPLQSIFGRSRKGKKMGKDTIYRQLNQHFSDEDDDLSDEESVLFRRPGDLELQLVPNNKDDVTFRYDRGKQEAEYKKSSNYLCFCALVTLAVMCLIGVALGVLAAKKGFFSSNQEPLFNTTLQTHNQSIVTTTQSSHIVRTQTENWKKFFTGYGGESCIRLLDVDGDGLEDIIIAAINASLSEQAKDATTYNEMEHLCGANGIEYPCVGFVIALRGFDGKELWQIRTRSEAFLLNCQDVDVNQDGQPDCLATGRQGMAAAIDPYKGEVIWSAEDEALVPSWNTYQMLPLSDWDMDGVPELLMMNGGDPDASPTNHNRSAGRLVVLSGKTGVVLQGTFLPLPNSKETYMTPVLYRQPGGHDYILLGSGGETVPGDLLGLSVRDLCMFLMKGEGQESCPDNEASLLWPDKGRDEHGMFVIYSGTTKGVMVPPLMLDMNNDNMDDLLVSAYDGHMLLLNGRNLEIIWESHFPGLESYSTPAPGYFNDDDVLDFMVHWCDGAWPDYTSSNVYVINGNNGTILWSMESAYFEMSSDLTLRTNQEHRDLFIFQVTGRGSDFKWEKNMTITRKHGHKVSKRHEAEESELPVFPKGNTTKEMIDTIKGAYRDRHLLCEEDISSFKVEVFIMDRTLMSSPVKIVDLVPKKHTYTIQKAALTRTGDHIDFGVKNETACTVMMPDARSTGAVADLDGDGYLEYLSIQTNTGTIRGSMYEYDGEVSHIEIQRINIKPILNLPEKRIQVTAEVGFHTEKQEKDIKDVEIIPMDRQQWTQYLGSRLDSRYETKGRA